MNTNPIDSSLSGFDDVCGNLNISVTVTSYALYSIEED
jgi:hypothetical protein